ncbi:MAG: autotransporter outer membrane beta-barrel domain-containing protein [Spirochaetes bacterium]|nr:autotransporter outer membrane beta-barrel domain-containing protein [Spirochaetota bacterium]
MKIYQIFFPVFIFFSLSVFFLIIPFSSAFSQTIDPHSYEKEITGRIVDGLMNISASTVKDSFVPMTHWRENEYLLTIVPAYCSINKAYDDPEVKGKDLKGWSAALGGGYALNKRLLLYGIAAGQSIKGNLYGKMYKDPIPAVEAEMGYRSLFLSPGAGFEFLPGKWLSIPVFFGPFIQHYKINTDSSYSETVSYTETSIHVSTAGSGILYGVTGGFAASAKILNKLKITPYYLYMKSFNKPEADADIDVTTSVTLPTSITDTESSTESLATEYINASMIGLSATLVSTNNLSFSASVGGYITSETGWYNEKFLNGLQMKSIVLAVTYTNGISEK